MHIHIFFSLYLFVLFLNELEGIICFLSVNVQSYFFLHFLFQLSPVFPYYHILLMFVIFCSGGSRQARVGLVQSGRIGCISQPPGGPETAKATSNCFLVIKNGFLVKFYPKKSPERSPEAPAAANSPCTKFRIHIWWFGLNKKNETKF